MPLAPNDSRGKEANRRRDEFHVDYGTGRDFEADVLRGCLAATHRFLNEIAGEMAADAALDALVTRVFGSGVPPGDWREELIEHDGDLVCDLPAGQVFHD